jgi:hypothetical protein
VEKYGTARQATDDNIIRRMRFACWVTKVTGTHSEYVIRIAIGQQQWLREREAEYYVIRTVPLLIFSRPSYCHLTQCNHSCIKTKLAQRTIF